MHHDNNKNSAEAEPVVPWLAGVPLEPRHGELALVIVHAGRAAAPPEGLCEVLRFHADGRGGWISAARAGNGQWGYINAQAQWLVPPTLQNARSFSEDGLARFCDGGRWGFLNLAGKVVIAPAFDHAQPFRGGVCAVQVGPRAWRIIDRHGRATGNEIFHELSVFGANGLARATLCKKDGAQRTHGFVDRTGRWVIEPRFHAVQPFGEAAAAPASLDGHLHGLIDARGAWVLAPRYPRIDAFNAEGLAFFAEGGAQGGGHGYLDTKGRVAVRGGEHLSPRMACAAVAHGEGGTDYLTAEGQPLPSPRLSYGADFSAESGFAIVRTAERASEESGVQALTPSAWGLLHADGRFVPAPQLLLEPLTDGDGWLVAPQPDTPLVPFLTRDGQLAYVDGEGAIVWRAHYDGQQVALLDAEGTPLWRSSVRENCWPPRPFFNVPLTDYLQGLQTLDGIVPVAVGLLAQAEAGLHGAAADEARAGTEAARSSSSADRPAQPLAGAAPAMHARRVLRTCLRQAHKGPYGFLAPNLRHAVDKAHSAMLQRLSARFGAPGTLPVPAVAGQAPAPHPHITLDAAQVWAVPLAKPEPHEDGTADTPGTQWLMLREQVAPGDGEGDICWELWLAAAPCLDALQRTHPPAHGAASQAQVQAPMQTNGAGNGAPEGTVQGASPAPEPPPPPVGAPHTAAPGPLHTGLPGLQQSWAAAPRRAAAASSRASTVGVASARALAAHLLLGLPALLGHLAVAMAAWQAEGPWVGLATLGLAGFSDLYWLWRFAMEDPSSPWLAMAALTAVAYGLGGWRLHHHLAEAFAPHKAPAHSR